MRDYRLYIKDIVAAMESIEEFIAGMDLSSFREDDKTASAVMRKLSRPLRSARRPARPLICRPVGRLCRGLKRLPSPTEEHKHRVSLTQIGTRV